MIPEIWVLMLFIDEEDFSLINSPSRRSTHKIDLGLSYTGDGKPFCFLDFLWLMVLVIPLCFLFFLGVFVYNQIK